MRTRQNTPMRSFKLTSKKLHINIFYIVLYMERENVVHNPLILYLHFIVTVI